MKLIFLYVNLFFILFSLYSDGKSLTVSGKVFLDSEKPVYIFLVDEETSEIPFTGIQELIVYPETEDLERGFLEYLFMDVSPGRYGIRVYQDMNNNGKLDKGLSGPKEPWGLSWNGNSKSEWPSFKNYCFDLLQEITWIEVFLE